MLKTLLATLLIATATVSQAETIPIPVECVEFGAAHEILQQDGLQPMFTATDVNGVMFQVWVNTEPDKLFFRAFFIMQNGLVCQASRGDYFEIFALGEPT